MKTANIQTTLNQTSIEDTLEAMKKAWDLCGAIENIKNDPDALAFMINQRLQFEDPLNALQNLIPQIKEIEANIKNINNQ